MAFLIFLCLFCAVLTIIAFWIINRMPFGPMIQWAARMIVLLVMGVTVLVMI